MGEKIDLFSGFCTSSDLGFTGEKFKKIVVKEDWNVEYFPFQAAVRTTISFFKTVYHTIQMIQFRSAPEQHYCMMLFKLFDSHHFLNVLL